MVDEPRLVALLRRVTEDVELLRDLGRERRETLATDRVRLLAVKYGFITAIEGCIRSAQHVAAAEGWRRPATNADAFRILADQGVIPGELATRLAAAAGFRNLLIHQYADVDDRRVVGYLDALDDLDGFVRAVLDWIAGANG